MKKVIIFGATGLVGAYGALYLKKYGYDVVAVGRRESDNGFFGINGIPYYSLSVQGITELRNSSLHNLGQIQIT